MHNILTIRLRNVQNRNCVQAKSQLWLRVYHRVVQRVWWTKHPFWRMKAALLQICPQLLAWPLHAQATLSLASPWKQSGCALHTHLETARDIFWSSFPSQIASFAKWLFQKLWGALECCFKNDLKVPQCRKDLFSPHSAVVLNLLCYFYTVVALIWL